MSYQIFCLVLLGIIVSVNCQTRSNDVFQLRNSVDFAYKLGNNFLDLIRGNRPPRQEDMAEIMSPNISKMEFKDVFQRFKPMLQDYSGYLTCFIIGLLFVIIMPLVGLFFCCCRCCGNCGGAAKPMDSKYANCKRVFFTICLAILNTIMLAGVVLAFINNQLINETLKNKDERVNGLKQLDSAFNLTEVGLDEILTSLNETSRIEDDRLAALDIITRHFQEMQMKVFNPKTEVDFLSKVDSIVTDVKSYEKFAALKTNYTDKGSNLKNQILSIKNELSVQLSYCSTSKCKQLQTQADKLQLNFNYDTVNSGLDEADKIIKKILNSDVKNLGNVRELLEGMSEKYKMRLMDEVDKMIENIKKSQRFKDTNKKVSKWVSILSGRLKSLQSNYGNATIMGKSLKAFAGSYDHLRMYVFIGFCCVLLLIVFFYYLGLCFGMCGERPYEEASLCNRGVGANLLMAAVAFAFFFSWFIMLVTMVLFMVGGPIQTEACRYITGRFPGGEKVMDDYVAYIIRQGSTSEELDSRVTIISLDALLNRCKDESLLEAFNITRKIIDIDSVYENYLKKPIEDMKSDASNLTPLEGLNKYIAALKEIENLFNNVDFQPGIAESGKTVTQISDLLGFIGNLKRLGKANLQDSIKKLETEVLPLESYQKEVNSYFRALHFLKENVVEVKKKLSDVKAAFTTKKNALLTETFDALQVSFRADGDKVVNSLYSRVKCDRLNKGLKKAVNAVCVTFLYPLNGYWYGLGVCLILFIPTIIFAVKLAGLYRKTEKYCSDYEEPDYMSYQGFYINPGDNIPLERKSNKQSSNKGYTPLHVDDI